VIFLDTGFLFAYVSENDQDHGRVNEVLEEHRGRRLSDFLLTTNHVVAETITLLSKRGHRDPGIRHDLAVKVGGSSTPGSSARCTTRQPRKSGRLSPSSRDTATRATASWTA